MLAELREEFNQEHRLQLAIDASDILTRTQRIAKKIRDIETEKR